MALGQNLVAMVNIKIAGKWVFTPLTLIIIGFDTHQHEDISSVTSKRNFAHERSPKQKKDHRGLCASWFLLRVPFRSEVSLFGFGQGGYYSDVNKNTRRRQLLVGTRDSALLSRRNFRYQSIKLPKNHGQMESTGGNNERREKERRRRCAKRQKNRESPSFLACGSGGSRSRLAKAAGKEPSGQIGEPLLKVEMLKGASRTGEAHVQVKMYKFDRLRACLR